MPIRPESFVLRCCRPVPLILAELEQGAPVSSAVASAAAAASMMHRPGPAVSGRLHAVGG
eukprot:747394-Hanusia_phi.AAC.6